MSTMSRYRIARMQKCLTQKQAAGLIGISKSYLCMIENQVVFPTMDILVAMKRIYGVDLS